MRLQSSPFYTHIIGLFRFFIHRQRNRKKEEKIGKTENGRLLFMRPFSFQWLLLLLRYWLLLFFSFSFSVCFSLLLPYCRRSPTPPLSLLLPPSHHKMQSCRRSYWSWDQTSIPMTLKKVMFGCYMLFIYRYNNFARLMLSRSALFLTFFIFIFFHSDISVNRWRVNTNGVVVWFGARQTMHVSCACALWAPQHRPSVCLSVPPQTYTHNNKD